MNHIPVKIPDSMTRVDVGPYLLGLRKHFGLSEQDVSDRLHIRVRYLRAMEAGDFAQLPTVVYARGYLHTYAEFLGLDADQVVERCFGEEAPAPIAIPPQGTARHRADWSTWRSGAIMGAVIAVIVLVVVQLSGRGGSNDAPEPVAAVPETLLGLMRTMAMPTGNARDCLDAAAWLACMRATHEWQVMEPAQSRLLEYEIQVMPSPFMLAQALSTIGLPEEVVAEKEQPKSEDASVDTSATSEQSQ